MGQCEDFLQQSAERYQEPEASLLMSGLRDLMQRADTLRAQEERADAARDAFRDAMAQLSEAVSTHADTARLEQALPALEAAARACIEERDRLHQQGESVRGLISGLNVQLGELLKKG